MGALTAVLNKLSVAINGSYNLVVSGTARFASGPTTVVQPFSYSITGVPTPDLSSEMAIASAFTSSINAPGTATIRYMTYKVKSNTASLVEFEVNCLIVVLGVVYDYTLNYKYSK